MNITFFLMKSKNNALKRLKKGRLFSISRYISVIKFQSYIFYFECHQISLVGPFLFKGFVYVIRYFLCLVFFYLVDENNEIFLDFF